MHSLYNKVEWYQIFIIIDLRNLFGSTYISLTYKAICLCTYIEVLYSAVLLLL
jgi:hypothetical protein